MTDNYTPDASDVRSEYVIARRTAPYYTDVRLAQDRVHRDEFDRWLAAHDAEVRKDEREKVAREIETSWRSKPPIPSRAESESVNDYLQGVRFGKITAARIAREEATQ